MSDVFLTTEEVAEYFMVSPQTVRRWVRQNKIPAIKLPSATYRFRERDIRKFVEERSTPSPFHNVRSIQTSLEV